MGTDFADWVASSRSKGLLEAQFSLGFHFGTGEKSMRERYEEEMLRKDEDAVRTVYEAEVDEETGDTVFVDQSRDPRDRFIPVPKGKVVPEEDYDRDGIRNRFDKCPETPLGALVDKDGCPNDGDNDGVPDGIDQCDDTPAIARSTVDQQGCPYDADFDGVPDYLDQCPNSAPAAEVDSSGCVPDSDFDGVADDFDICANTPAGVPVDRRGCPEMDIIFSKRVISSLFHTGGTRIDSTTTAVLDTVANYMVLFPKTTAVIYGYTDNIGPDDANQALSEKRARAVLRYLVDAGIAENRLQAVGLGETNFIAPNRTRAGREQNRRVEIEFSYPD
jgi:outer membrane protein OmpA-like peptidoglycan-associated protein